MSETGAMVTVREEATAVLPREQAGMLAMATMSEPEFEARLTALKRGQERIKRIKQELMEEDTHYGVIPGTKKPALLKPGAEVLSSIYGLRPDFIPTIEAGDGMSAPTLRVMMRCELHLGDITGPVVAVGYGAANSWERKHRYRRGERVCPACGVVGQVIKGKEEYGGGWLCWKSKGGCGAKWPDGAAEIEGQQVGDVANPDPYDLENTLVKMAKKRCLGSNTPVLVRTHLGVSRVRVDTVYTMYRDGTPLELPGPEGSWLKVRGMVREERPFASRVRLGDGSAIYATPEHRFPVVGESEALPLADLSGRSLTRTRIDIGSHCGVDPEIGWVVGLFIAEGHFHRAGGVSFTLAAEEESFADRIVKVAERLGSVVTAQRRRVGAVLDVDVSGFAFWGLISQFVSGHHSYGKHLSRYAWRQGGAFAEQVLRGYLAGDGGGPYERPGRRQEKWILGFTRRNFALAADLRTLAGVLGWRLSLKHGTASCAGKTFPTFTGWMTPDIPAYHGLNLEEALSVERVNRPSIVYDIEVEDPHLFVLPNGIVSHNSHIDAALTGTASSDLFTQDLEENAPSEKEHAAAGRPPAGLAPEGRQPGEDTTESEAEVYARAGVEPPERRPTQAGKVPCPHCGKLAGPSKFPKAGKEFYCYFCKHGFGASGSQG